MYNTLRLKVLRSPQAKPFFFPASYQFKRSTTSGSYPARSMASTTPLKVLLLGVHMNPGEPFTEEHLIKLIDSDVAKGQQHGLDIKYQLTFSAEPDYQTIASRLREQPWDIIAIGAGVRFPKDRSALFEWLVNAAVRFVKPTPMLVFNSTPDGVVEACLRAKPEIERIDRLEQQG